MPRRRVTPAMKLAQAKWQAAGALSRKLQANREAQFSFSKPRLSPTGGPRRHAPDASGYRRRGKVMGSAAQHHRGGGVTLSPFAAQVVSGQKPTASPKAFADSAIRGDITQARGVPYRRKKHKPSFKGHQLTKKGK